MEDILLSISSPPELDLELFLLWVNGSSLEEAQRHKVDAMKRQFHQYQHRASHESLQADMDGDGRSSRPAAMTVLGLEFPRSIENYLIDFDEMIKFDTIDQYRAFQTLEHYLMQPRLLKSQSLCSISPELQAWTIEKYWALDDSFVREILNKRLVKSRKDLEDISESTGLHLRRITRQLENIKRIYGTFEDTPNLVGNIYNLIAKNYLLSHSLCKRYACITFLLYSKFTITSKRRMQKASCEHLESCAAAILAFLCLDSPTFFRVLSAETTPAKFDSYLLDHTSVCWAFVWKLISTVDTVEVDKELLGSLRSLRALYTADALDVLCLSLRHKLGPTVIRKLDTPSSLMGGSKLRTVVKSLFQLGANLSQSREYRDILEDVLTKIAEPLEEAGLSSQEVSSFLRACVEAVGGGLLEKTGAVPTSAGGRPGHSGSLGGGDGTGTSLLPPPPPLPLPPPSGTGIVIGTAMGPASGTAVGPPTPTSYGAGSAPMGTPPANLSPSPTPSLGAGAGVPAPGGSIVASQSYSSTHLGSNPSGAGLAGPGGTAGSKGSARAEQLRRDWLRFVVFVKLALLQLVADRRGA